MADDRARPARTVLEQHIRDQRMTLEEFVEHAERFAREHHEPGRLSLRHLQRLIAGKREGTGGGRPLGRPHPATARLLERLTGQPVDVLLAAPVPPTGADESAAELRQMRHAARRIDRSVLGLLDEQVTAIRRLDRQLGATVAYAETQTKLSQVSQLLSHSMTPATREPLAALLSEICTLAGWQALDTGQVTDAWRHYERGRTAAIESGSPVYHAHAEAEQAFVLLDIGETTDAVNMMETARARAENTAPRVLRSWLAAAHGEALAANDQQSASLHAFDQATTLLPSNDTCTERPYVALNPVHLARWRGHALARLGAPDAIGVLVHVLDQLDETFARAETALRVDLATALAATGERMEAFTHTAAASRLANAIGSVRQRQRIDKLSRQLRDPGPRGHWLSTRVNSGVPKQVAPDRRMLGS